MSELELTIRTDGSIGAIHNDALVPLYEEGKATAKRASHVEPVDGGECVCWTADLSLVNGPKLGPYRYRSEALAAEVEWLKRNGF
jgi:hypothetical protein